MLSHRQRLVFIKDLFASSSKSSQQHRVRCMQGTRLKLFWCSETFAFCLWNRKEASQSAFRTQKHLNFTNLLPSCVHSSVIFQELGIRECHRRKTFSRFYLHCLWRVQSHKAWCIRLRRSIRFQAWGLYRSLHFHGETAELERNKLYRSKRSAHWTCQPSASDRRFLLRGSTQWPCRAS